MSTFEERARAEAGRRWPSNYELDFGYPAQHGAFEAGALWAHEQGCCTSCDGLGTGHDPETNGRCWDCRGTGHAHEQEPTEEWIRADQSQKIAEAINLHEFVPDGDHYGDLSHLCEDDYCLWWEMTYALQDHIAENTTQ